MNIDITKQCTVGFEFSNNEEALAYLYAPGGKKIGLFDKSGFHYMMGYEAEDVYYIENSYEAHGGIRWFKVYEKMNGTPELKYTAEAFEDMYKVLQKALLYLEWATTDNFSKGGDKKLRQNIKNVIAEAEGKEVQDETR